MTITLPLQPQEEDRLYAMADAKGLSVGALVREVLDGIRLIPHCYLGDRTPKRVSRRGERAKTLSPRPGNTCRTTSSDHHSLN